MGPSRDSRALLVDGTRTAAPSYHSFACYSLRMNAQKGLWLAYLRSRSRKALLEGGLRRGQLQGHHIQRHGCASRFRELFLDPLVDCLLHVVPADQAYYVLAKYQRSCRWNGRSKISDGIPEMTRGKESIRFFLWCSRQSGMDLLEEERGLLLAVVLGHGVERELVVLYRLAGADGQASQHKGTTRVRRAHLDNGEPLPY